MNTLSLRAEFDSVYNSLVNGQNRQAIEQAEEIGLDEIPYLLDYLSNELNQPEIAIKFCKAYFTIKAKG